MRGCVILAVLGLAGCASVLPESQQARMKQALDPAIGNTVALYAAERGLPTDSVKLAENQGSFRWVWTRQGNGALIPVGGTVVVAPPQQQSCTVILLAHTAVAKPELRDWIVDGYRWSGFC